MSQTKWKQHIAEVPDAILIIMDASSCKCHALVQPATFEEVVLPFGIAKIAPVATIILKALRPVWLLALLLVLLHMLLLMLLLCFGPRNHFDIVLLILVLGFGLGVAAAKLCFFACT
jgi:hypothetical protein